jgi:transcription elongation factor GreA
MADEPITAEGIDALRAEIDELEGPRRREMAARIKAARELGDLKENAEYHIAKDDQAHLETRIKRLRERLAKAVVVEADTSSEVFGFGRTAEVTDVSSGKTSTWTLVGPTEADLAGGKLSAESPVGRALRDARAGDQVELETPGGLKTFRVERLVD